MVLTLLTLLAGLCLLLIVWAYAGYPAFVWILSRFRSRAAPADESPEQSLTLLIAAYNEELVIGEKIENALQLAWPHGEYEVVVVSDGSTDRTDEIVRAFNDPRVRLLRIPKNAGKTNALNHAIRRCCGTLVALSDANSLYEPDALLRLAEPLADPAVGAVCGELKYRMKESSTAGESEGLYWKYEKAIKTAESHLGSLIGANGSIYMIRREEYPFPRRDLMDDLGIPLLIFLRTRKGTRYEPRAVAWEEPGQDFAAEYRRKVRIITRGFHTLQTLAPAWVRRPLFAFRIVSHKFLRWLAPLFALLLLLVSVAGTVLSPTGANPLLWLLVAQCVCWAAGVAAAVSPALRQRSRPLGLLFYFLVINAASLQAMWNCARGRRVTTWRTIRERTP